VRVQAKNAIGWGDYSGCLRFTTHPPLPPAQPILNVLRIGDKSLRLQWSLTGDGVQQHSETQLHMAYEYIVYMRPLGQTNWSECHRGLGSRSYKVTGLSEASVYSFYVRAQFASPCKNNIIFNTLTSTSKVIHVQTSKPIPEQCKAPKLVRVTANNCTFEWTPISPLQDGDEIIYSVQLLSVTTALPTGLSSTDCPDTVSSLGQLPLVPLLGKHPVEIYRGPNTQFSEERLLEPGQSYVVRVCAIRLWKTPLMHLQSLLFAAAQNQYDLQEDTEADDEDDEPSQHSDSSDQLFRLPIKLNDVVTQYQKSEMKSNFDCEERVGAYSAGLYFHTPTQGERTGVDGRKGQSEGPLTPAVTMQLFSATYSTESPVSTATCTSANEQGLFSSAWNLVGSSKKKPKHASTRTGSGTGSGGLAKFLGILRHPNDRQWALVIVVAFTLISILTAWLLAYLIGEENGQRQDSGRGNCRTGHKSTFSAGCTTD
ncbi:Fibronectin type III domain-containing protein 3B, partial [Cichlidogyrus casuarinus]